MQLSQPDISWHNLLQAGFVLVREKCVGVVMLCHANGGCLSWLQKGVGRHSEEGGHDNNQQLACSDDIPRAIRIALWTNNGGIYSIFDKLKSSVQSKLVIVIHLAG